MESIKIIKIGGNIINNDSELQSFLQTFSTIPGKKILIHGGGVLATQLAEQIGIHQEMIEGRRVTDSATLKIITMVYAGYINKKIVAQLQHLHCDAIGICGADGHIIEAHKRISKIDYGFVGDVNKINTQKLNQLITNFDTVVIAPVTLDNNGQLLNTNADTIAQEIAKSLSNNYQTALYYCFEKQGVLMNIDDPASLLPIITPSLYDQLKKESKIFAGMIPKLDNAFSAIHAGVNTIHIGRANDIIAMTEGKSGTKITL